jgi:hypothetical protein
MLADNSGHADLTIQDQQKLKEAIQFEASLHPVVISSGETIAELRENRDYDAAIKAIQVSMVDGARVAMVAAALLSVISLFCLRLPKTKTVAS